MKKLFTLALAALCFAACNQKKEVPFTDHADVADEENTWTQVPLSLIFVDCQYERDSVELNCK